MSINDTLKNHKVLILGLLPAHAISSCDTVPMYCGTGKKKVPNVAEKLKLLFLVQVEATQDR